MRPAARRASAIVAGVTLSIGAASLLAHAPTATPAGAAAPHRVDVRVENIARETVLLHDVSGGFERHPQVIRDLLIAAKARGIAPSQPFGLVGVYPQDPDATAPEQLTWQIGMVVAAPAEPPLAEYPAKSLDATLAAVADSTVEASGADGLAVTVWLMQHGYVQTAPVRMYYGAGAADHPERNPTRIVIPVKKRPSGLVPSPLTDAQNAPFPLPGR